MAHVINYGVLNDGFTQRFVVTSFRQYDEMTSDYVTTIQDVISGFEFCVMGNDDYKSFGKYVEHLEPEYYEFSSAPVFDKFVDRILELAA